MNHKYLILLLFIFLVFLMGSVNSTVTNVFYNNTTGTQDHALLTNLSYDDSSHIGFQSSAALNDNVSSLGYVTNTTGNFINKSGDNYTGKYNHTNAIAWGSSGSIKNVNNPYRVLNNDYFITELRGNGIQNWWMYATSSSPPSYNIGEKQGWIGYSFPGTGAGIALRNGLETNTTIIHMCGKSVWGNSSTNATFSAGLCFAAGNSASTPVDQVELDQQGNLTIMALTGSGNAYSCLDSSGKLYRGSPTC